jgi:2-phosphosulfolactate phosphatase
MYYEQEKYDIRFEWGIRGIEVLGPTSEVIIVVDVLSFTTSVEVAVSNGAIIYPYRFKDQTVLAYAEAKGALVASGRSQSDAAYSLSPVSLKKIPKHTKLILPSPNGSTLSLAAGKYATTLAGCFRNCRSVGAKAVSSGQRITVIACGEQWPDGTIRPALEDYAGAGAIISHLSGSKSPEAVLAEKSFLSIKGELQEYIEECASGIELVNKGFKGDVIMAAELDLSNAVPILEEDRFVNGA